MKTNAEGVLSGIDAYYREESPEKRGQILEKLLAEDPGEENQLRRELYDLRYAGKSQRKDGDLADGYIMLWMTMKLTVDNSNGLFGSRRSRKELSKMLDKLGITRFMGMDETARHLLYQEFYHMAALYIDSGLTDRNYTSAFMGLMPLKDDQIQLKLTKDVYKVAYLMPRNVDMVEEFSVFTKASLDAFRSILPDCRGELDELIENTGA